jgi:hypothetical protein
MDIQLDVNTWVADGMVKYLKKCGYDILAHVANPGGDGIDSIVIRSRHTKKFLSNQLRLAGFVKSQFMIVG